MKIKALQVGSKFIGEGNPCFIIAEIGINHNGSREICKKLIDAAVVAGCDAVKFQKRTPELCVPKEQRNLIRETPWGQMTYMEYRERLEFSFEDYLEIEKYCQEKGIIWFASCWDVASVEFMEDFKPACYKIASASLTDDDLLQRLNATNKPLILSTGMSNMDQIQHAIDILKYDKLILAHCTSSYPCKPEELNLRMINTLRSKYDCPIGYSGHEVGLQTTYAAVVLGACFVERHITLDRAMWGSDQAASVEPGGFMRMVRDIRTIEKSLGDGVKVVYESEKPIMTRLRRSK